MKLLKFVLIIGILLLITGYGHISIILGLFSALIYACTRNTSGSTNSFNSNKASTHDFETNEYDTKQSGFDSYCSDGSSHSGGGDSCGGGDSGGGCD